MTTRNDSPQNDPPRQTPVPDLPWFETLRTVLEPYQPAENVAEADQHFSSSEIIQSIERHHGVPQGPAGKDIALWVAPADFVRAMKHLGFQEQNTGGLQLQWLMKKKV